MTRPPPPTLHSSALERPAIDAGPDFIGLELDSVRRVRQYAVTLRGVLLARSGTPSKPGRSHVPSARAPDGSSVRVRGGPENRG